MNRGSRAAGNSPMAASPSRLSLSSPRGLLRSPLFPPIPEAVAEEDDHSSQPTQSESPQLHHPPTPLPPPKKCSNGGVRGVSVSCSNCRPSSHPKTTTIVPFDSSSSPHSILRSFFYSLARRTPSSSDSPLLDRFSPAGSTGSFPLDQFLLSVSSSRSATRHLVQTLTAHLPARIRPGPQTESFLNRVFFSGFELPDDEETRVADPLARCEANRAAYVAIRELTWDEVLTKGTKHYSYRLSRFCDRKMSEVAGCLRWAGAWPEPLLKAFFGAAKSAWVVRLMARSVYPHVPVLRVDRGARFDGRFMEDVGRDRVGMDRLEPASVKVLVAPGFHVYSSASGVVKCRVLCLYKGARNRGESFA
ncbi:uncharacterized protein [Typha latifolia]|uniref:uncharacterized protein n=1 Tax=Typha latifolia TaxID=4733 RepID=UPI003C2DB3DB